MNRFSVGEYFRATAQANRQANRRSLDADQGGQSFFTDPPSSLLAEQISMLTARASSKIHLADRRRAVTVCGAVVSARQIGTYAESILLLGDKTIVRREVFSGVERVKRAYRCRSCFRRVERIL